MMRNSQVEVIHRLNGIANGFDSAIIFVISFVDYSFVAPEHQNKNSYVSIIDDSCFIEQTLVASGHIICMAHI